MNPGTWDDRNAFDLEEGMWIEVSYPLADLVDASDVTNPETWSQIWLQAQGINRDVYFDFIGFR